jgi:hypothetical protein
MLLIATYHHQGGGNVNVGEEGTQLTPGEMQGKHRPLPVPNDLLHVHMHRTLQ